MKVIVVNMMMMMRRRRRREREREVGELQESVFVENVHEAFQEGGGLGK